MENSTITPNAHPVSDFLSGGGELGQMIREYDWSKTSLGAVEMWPQSLRTCIRIMLTSRQPIWIGWGKELIKFYNDPYKAIVGGKHPWALGSPASVVWKDIWKDIEPMLKQVMEKDEGTYAESQLLIMERNGYPEETYYTFSYTPIPGDDGITAGMICANTDDTDRIISERQLKTLTQLGARLTDAKSNDEVVRESIRTLGENKHDFPFAIFYLLDGNTAVFSASTDAEVVAGQVAPLEIDLSANATLPALLKEAALSRKLQILPNLKANLGNLPKGAWGISSDKAIILPVVQGGAKQPYGLLLVGGNPYRLLDEKYSSFFSLVTDQMATSFANVHAWDEERKRAEALAELDRAKTTFFSNISHEFRTPLTLLMGPVEEVLNNPDTTDDDRARMQVAYRNVLRMQKLVNTLMEFSRIEAGRMEGRYSRVDIAVFTEDMVSTFRSAVEKAGMELRFIKNNIPDEVYVDVDMWEKIILNLLSNAFKYTTQGVISVEVTQVENKVHVIVADTGVGIAPDQLDKIFNRFHRVENDHGRSQEGTGIGLAFVKELVRLHAGTIEVSSTPGKGSSFVVAIPAGKEHLPADRITVDTFSATGSKHSAAFVQEALKWAGADERLYEEAAVIDEDLPEGKSGKRQTIIFADDNTDMRDYVERLLARQYRVIRAADGNDAYKKMLQYMPDLLLSDIMMPGLDGFGLLKKVRTHPDLKNIPVIFLSARAGDEAKVEGLGTGADDYMVKPFSAKELMARVDANIKIAKNRVAAENNLRNFIRQAPVAMTLLKGENLTIELANNKALELWGKKREEVINTPALEAFPELVQQGFDSIFKNVYTKGEPFRADEMPIGLIRHGAFETVHVNFIYEPLRNAEGIIEGIVGVGIDVTEQVKARKKIEEAEESARLAIESADLGTYIINFATDEMKTSDRFKQIWGITAQSVTRGEYASFIHPEDQELRDNAHQESIQSGNLHYEARVVWKDNSAHWVRVKGKVLYDKDGMPANLLGVIQDITEQKLFAEELSKQVKQRTIELQRSNEDLQQFAHVASHDLKEPVRKIKTYGKRLEDEYGGVIDEKAKGFLAKIQHATDRMIAMVDGVLNYSSVNSTEQGVETIDLDATFKDIEADLEILMQKVNAKIVKGDLCKVEGSPFLIYQLFYNLINNSLKFLKAGQQPVISISSEIIEQEGEEMAKIVFADNGIGFAPEYSEKIFNTFTRLHSKDRFEGTGLGLSLCKKIVERHHGHIFATGQLDVGATFTIMLPLQQKQGFI